MHVLRGDAHIRPSRALHDRAQRRDLRPGREQGQLRAAVVDHPFGDRPAIAQHVTQDSGAGAGLEAAA